MGTKKESINVRIFLTEKPVLDDCLADKGLTQVELVSRLIRWYSAQDKTLQNIILGNENPLCESEILDMIKRRVVSEGS